MIKTCYLVCYDEVVLGALLREDLMSSAGVLGLDLCFHPECDCQEHGHHAHLRESMFGPPELYPADDVKRAGLYFREGTLPELGQIRWEFYHPSDIPPVVYFKRSKLVV